MFAWLYRGAAVLAAGCLAAGAWLAYRSPELDSTLEPPFVVETDRELGEVSVGDRELTFQITNPASRPRRIMGLNDGCGKGYCLYAKDESQIVVPAGGTVSYSCKLVVRNRGPFDAKITIFLEDNGVREEPLIVRGVGVAPQEPTRDRQPGT
jgi:hypothetical protein